MFFHRVVEFPLGIILAVIVIVVVLGGCDAVLSEAEPVISNYDCIPDAGLINDQPDAGWSASFRLRNAGKAGNVHVKTQLSTSEGEWSREQTIHFDAGEARSLKYFFYEPTINATNITCNVKTTPKLREFRGQLSKPSPELPWQYEAYKAITGLEPGAGWGGKQISFWTGQNTKKSGEILANSAKGCPGPDKEGHIDCMIEKAKKIKESGEVKSSTGTVGGSSATARPTSKTKVCTPGTPDYGQCIMDQSSTEQETDLLFAQFETVSPSWQTEEGTLIVRRGASDEEEDCSPGTA